MSAKLDTTAALYCDDTASNARVRPVTDQACQNVGDTFAILNKIQDHYGYLVPSVVREAAAEAGIPFARMMALATQYDTYTFEPLGKHVLEICDGTTCHVLGAPKIIQKGEELLEVPIGKTTKDGFLTLKKVNCIGACSQAPLIVVDNEVCGQVRLQDVGDIIKRIESKQDNVP